MFRSRMGTRGWRLAACGLNCSQLAACGSHVCLHFACHPMESIANAELGCCLNQRLAILGFVIEQRHVPTHADSALIIIMIIMPSSLSRDRRPPHIGPRAFLSGTPLHGVLRSACEPGAPRSRPVVLRPVASMGLWLAGIAVTRVSRLCARSAVCALS